MASSVEQLASNAVSAATGLARRGRLLAGGVALMAALAVVILLVLTWAATDGGARTFWTIVALVIGVVAVGAPVLARATLGRAVRQAPQVVEQLRSLLHRDEAAKRTVIDIDTSEAAATRGPAKTPAVIGQARQFFQLREFAGSFGELNELRQVVSSVATFPGKIAIGVLGTVVAAVLGLVMLLVWIF